MVQLVEEFLLGKCVQESFVVDKGWTTDGDFQLFVKVAKETAIADMAYGL